MSHSIGRPQPIYLTERETSVIEVLEKVHKKATKIIPEIRHLPYRDRLKVCKLPTLHYRQVRGDMIEIYKILTGKYDADVTPN